ncbi:uncharacterized protein L3040_008028 [Drepanopeziza brunnea f. sp. 'multigermtubi']|uniref:uncharacterized protein n=1 Tax=Drepanopeziza brunnea f. sp. 'multigermtubi' TaxID=698441 RepID=UPI002382C3A4|nr:hypothetical protein L3040_008028 [Drepanopeziza brunnea f. sp. 'multigermtubi']
MMLLSQSVCSVLLAASFLFGKGHGREVIGYRTVSPWETGETNQNLRPVRNPNFDRKREKYNVLGSGYYMVNKPGGWEPTPPWWNGARPQYCVIEADMDKVRKVPKIWIPESYSAKSGGGSRAPRKRLWTYMTKNDDAINEYIKSMGVRNPKKAFRFAYMPGPKKEHQMVIPTETINNNELDFWAQCFPTKEQLLARSDKEVDWDSWGIIGDPDGAALIPQSGDSSNEGDRGSWRWWWDCLRGKCNRQLTAAI